MFAHGTMDVLMGRMSMIVERRTLLAAAVLTPMLALPGCAQMGGFNLTDAIKRLLTLSSQRAFSSLMQENGFFDSQVAKIALPNSLGGSMGSSILSTLLNSNAFRDRMSRQVNRAAEKGAALAAPIVTDAIGSIGVNDAMAIINGGPTAATDVLSRALGTKLISTMLPGITDGLKLFDSGIVTEALKMTTGIDFAGLRDDVSRKASDGIFKAIGMQEAAIRANPSETGDPVLTAVFGLIKK
jgi:hypothetical protein